MATDQDTQKHRVQFLEWMGHRGTRVILLKIRTDRALILTEKKPLLDRPMWVGQRNAGRIIAWSRMARRRR